MTDTNPFGGSPHGLYVPLSEDEREVLQRLVDAKDLRIVIVGWGIHHAPQVRFGDKRIQFQFTACFSEPFIPIAVTFLDFEIQTHAGQPVHRVRQPTVYGGQPLLLGANLSYEFVVDISIDQMSAEFVKQIKPGAHGLTTRHGNMHLTQHLQQLYAQIKEGEASVRKMDEDRIEELERTKT